MVLYELCLNVLLKFVAVLLKEVPVKFEWELFS